MFLTIKAMKDITNDLKNFIKSKGYTQEQLANELGVSQVRINQLLNGIKPFGKKTAAQWHNLFGLSEAFLLTGEGEMLANNQQGNNNTSVGNNSINGNNNNDSSTIEVILRLTKMLEQERAEKEQLKRELDELRSGEK